MVILPVWSVSCLSKEDPRGMVSFIVLITIALGGSLKCPVNETRLFDSVFGKRVLTYWENRGTTDYSQLNGFIVGVENYCLRHITT